MEDVIKERQGVKRPELFGISPVPAWYPKETVHPARGLVLYHGGPIIECPQIYAGFWGSQWNDFESLFSGLRAFVRRSACEHLHECS